ncbi:MAG: hypothetical protein DDG59_14915 [Anaerolineae bacterium]|jgi:hypothetical protein|nr:MAG: hypothetical protein DDG59_14915 [Anaerolineae bacterium]
MSFSAPEKALRASPVKPKVFCRVMGSGVGDGVTVDGGRVTVGVTGGATVSVGVRGSVAVGCPQATRANSKASENRMKRRTAVSKQRKLCKDYTVKYKGK